MARVRISIERRAAIRVGWLLTVLAAAGIGWGLGRLGDSEPPAVEPPREVVVLVPVVEPAPEPPPAPEPAPGKPRPKPAPPPPEPEPEPEVVAEPEPPPPPDPGALARALASSHLADAGDDDGARQSAEALLAEHPSYTDLVTALQDDGSDEVRAWLTALRVLQLAGHETVARDVAREMKRSYASTEEVASSIQQWRILHPRIASIESKIQDDRYVLVVGTVENPDVGDVRRLKVIVEALDAGGNLLGTTEARVRPRVLEPGGFGVFQVDFKGLDPASVLRTRATITEWESEVPGAG